MVRAGMSVPVVLAVFPIIFLGELPDKTMFASLVLSTHGRPRAVWLGAAMAFTVHVAIAVTIGVAVFHLLPHRVVEALVAAMFLLGAVLALREASRASHHDERIGAIVTTEARAGHKVVGTAFIVVFLAEWGDLTQILTANLAARLHSPLSVGVGSLLALWAVAAVAVATGSALQRFVDVRVTRIVTAGVLLVLALVTGILAATA